MNNKATPIIIFILSMSLFLGIRIYSGRQYSSDASAAGTVSEPNSESSTGDDTLSSSASYEASASENDTTLSSDSDISSDSGDAAGSEDNISNDPWHGIITPVSKFEGSLPRIICWGDSLTESLDRKTAYPDCLRDMTGCIVNNYGVSKETTSMIAMREGGIKVSVKATVIPEDAELIPVFLSAENGDPVSFLDNGGAGINPCSIDGIEGTLSQLNGSYYFERSQKGFRRSIEDGTAFKTFAASDAEPSDILVIFTGTNDLPNADTIYDVIDIQKKMIAASSSDKYIIVGLTYSNSSEDLDVVNEILANEYGEHFLDLREYLLNYGLADAGISATSDDINDIASGTIPTSLRKDYVHGNMYYHRLLAEQLYRKMQYLGYLPLSEE